jgi:hypothetical protein
MDMQTVERQTCGETDKETDRQIDRQEADRQSDRQTAKQTDGQADSRHSSVHLSVVQGGCLLPIALDSRLFSLKKYLLLNNALILRFGFFCALLLIRV